MPRIEPRTRIACLVLTLLVFAGCARRENDDTDAVAAPPETPATTAPAAAPAPPPDLAAVRIDVTLAPEADAKLKTAGESVSVEVTYGGDPSPGSTVAQNEFGLVELSKSVHELQGSGSVQISEDDLDKSRLDQIVGQPQVMVNVVSGKKTTPNNLLACDFYWDTLSAAGRTGVKIACKLNDEPAAG